MARIRTIKPEFWKHEDLSELPEATHMLAAALLNHADDEGYFNANPGLVKSECCPLREPSMSIQDSLNLLSSIGFIRRCIGTDGKRYGQVVTFLDHQRVNRPTPSKIKSLCDLWDGSPTTHAVLSEDSPPEGKGKEQGKEGNRELGKAPPSSSAKPTTLTLSGIPVSPSPADLSVRRAERLSSITQDAIEAYNRLMGKPNGKLAPVSAKVGRKTRLKQVDRSLVTASEICDDQFGDKKITLEFWETYFTTCLEDDFTNGTGPYTGSHANWRPDFEYLTRPATMLKLFERAASEEVA